MSEHLAETLVRAFFSNGNKRADVSDAALILDAALETYGPATLGELYMAVRAQEGDAAFPELLDALEDAAQREPDLALRDFAERLA